MKQPQISRRTVLKGIGAISIALPLLEEMTSSVAAAEKALVPVRAFNVFFGLGKSPDGTVPVVGKQVASK